jgi:hypothetical protein
MSPKIHLVLRLLLRFILYLLLRLPICRFLLSFPLSVIPLKRYSPL